MESVEVEAPAGHTSKVAALEKELEKERERSALLEEKLKVAERVTELIFRRDAAKK
jgi:hypothetical protein